MGSTTIIPNGHSVQKARGELEVLEHFILEYAPSVSFSANLLAVILNPKVHVWAKDRVRACHWKKSEGIDIWKRKTQDKMQWES